MNSQGSLFEDQACLDVIFDNTEPLARLNDPDTSKEAAERYTTTNRDTDKGKVLDGVRKHPNHTARELAELIQLTQHIVARRLPDLLRDGFVNKGKVRPCWVSGMKAATWREA
jgi:predicted HTH transcriptional regulator